MKANLPRYKQALRDNLRQGLATVFGSQGKGAGNLMLNTTEVSAMQTLNSSYLWNLPVKEFYKNFHLNMLLQGNAVDGESNTLPGEVKHCLEMEIHDCGCDPDLCR